MISVVLIEPERMGNIGAIARAMGNFGFKELVLINPKCSHLSKIPMDRAVHAKDILRKAKIFAGAKEDTIGYLKDFDYLIGTTAKLGSDYNVPRVPLTPNVLAEKIKHISKKKKIAVLFGREDIGLTNDEIMLCDFIVAIPSSPKYPTMNISHACSIILYELFQAMAAQGEKIGGNIAYAGKDEKKHIARLFNDVLGKLAFSTKDKKETQRKVWKRVFGKAMLTKREAFAVMGFFKKVLGKR